MKPLFCVVKMIFCGSVYCTNTIEMFEKCALLIIGCDISNKSFEKLPIACENCAKTIIKKLSRIQNGLKTAR